MTAPIITSNYPIRRLSDFFSQLFPYKVQKISVDVGFTCPNRDGTKGYGGCSYCNNKTFVPGYCSPDEEVGQQLERGIQFFARKYPQMRYLAYFQSYTNTYGDTDKLVELYRQALEYEGVVGLVISTRPDCVSSDLLAALSDLARDHFVMMEYGVESTLDRTLDLIHRGHTYGDARASILATVEAGLYVGVHMILGLPGESRAEMLHHADLLSALPIHTLKLHQLQIVRGSLMERQYLASPTSFDLFTEEEYIDLCVAFARRVNPAIVIERFTAQAPSDMLLAPRWGTKNHLFAQRLLNAMMRNGYRQGDLYQP